MNQYTYFIFFFRYAIINMKLSKTMHKLTRDFVSEEQRNFSYKVGEIMASALSGFVVGVFAATVIWMLAFHYINNFILAAY
jgi:hypothetical protein